jgi:hypothetical protein
MMMMHYRCHALHVDTRTATLITKHLQERRLRGAAFAAGATVAEVEALVMKTAADKQEQLELAMAAAKEGLHGGVSFFFVLTALNGC